jgi:hypothetical protein
MPIMPLARDFRRCRKTIWETPVSRVARAFRSDMHSAKHGLRHGGQILT